jgi:epoxyqueuosine reductase
MELDLKQQIITQAKNLGLDIIGFAPARTLLHVRGYLDRRVKESRHTTLEWDDLAERVDPELLLQGVKTVITLGVSYYHPEPKPAGGLRGTLSRSAWGTDYHLVLGRKLKELAQFIEDMTGARVEPFVDTGPPVDRAWGIEGGVGWSGKNCALIHPHFGSWVFLGNIFTDLVLEPDTPLIGACGECDLCLKACPTQALRQEHIIDPFRCVSYLTQMKGFVPREYRSLMGTKIYGCDTCQVVCPANKQAAQSSAVEFKPDPELAFPLLTDLLSLSNREFKAQFGRSAAGWRGRTVLQRNALISLGNSKSKESKGILCACLKDSRPVIRGHAAWALGEIGEGIPEMRQALEQEQDPTVKEELVNALNKVAGRQDR